MCDFPLAHSLARQDPPEREGGVGGGVGVGISNYAASLKKESHLRLSSSGSAQRRCIFRWAPDKLARMMEMVLCYQRCECVFLQVVIYKYTSACLCFLQQEKVGTKGWCFNTSFKCDVQHVGQMERHRVNVQADKVIQSCYSQAERFMMDYPWMYFTNTGAWHNVSVHLFK